MALLGVDLGSSGCKAVVFHEDGKPLSAGTHTYAPRCGADGAVELDPETLFNAFIKAVGTAAVQSPEPVTAFAVSSHGESYVPLAADGRPAGAMVMNVDNRAVQEAADLENELGCARIYDGCGVPPHAMFAIPKILWRKRHVAHCAAERFLSAGDYILHRLGVEPLTDYSLACRTMGFDIRRKEWSGDVLDAAGLQASQFAVPVQAGTVAGVLGSAMARALHLDPGIPVSVGGHDQPCAILGAGVLAPGEGGVSAGTYECLAITSMQPYNTPDALCYRLNSYCHVVPDRYITLAFFPAGVAVQWVVQQLCGLDALQAQAEGCSVYDLLARIVGADSAPTGICIAPHWVGACNPHWDVRATGVIAGITPACTRHQLYQAVYEGIACELALNIDVLERLTGPINDLRISGGGARSPFTVQLRADIAQKPFSMLDTPETVCKGAAMLAGIGSGVFTDSAQATVAMVHQAGRILPVAGNGARYARQMRRYQALFDGLRLFRAQ